PLIALALPHIGHPAIRNRGTVGGSLAFADPAAELPACVIALDGESEIVGPQGQLTVKADEFFKDLFATALTPRDVLTAIRVPAPASASRSLRRATEATAGWDSPPARAPTASASTICASSISASARLRCACGAPSLYWRTATWRRR